MIVIVYISNFILLLCSSRTKSMSDRQLDNISIRYSNSWAEWIQWISQQWIVARDETPLVLFDVIDFTGHIIITTDNEYFILNEERFVTYPQLVHMMQRLPVLCIHIKQMYFSVTIGILTTDQ